MKIKHIVDYVAYVQQKRELVDFEIRISDLNNLNECIVDQEQKFICSFSFFEDSKKPCIKYSIKSELTLTCQESLEMFNHPFNIDNTMVIVEDERLAENSIHEPFICHDNIIDLKDIIREEILLDLPLVPKKPGSSCKKVKKHSYYSEREIVVEEKPNPFAILKELK